MIAPEIVEPRKPAPTSPSVRSDEVAEWAVADGVPFAVFAQLPESAKPLPVIVLCHGLGGEHLGYAALGQHLAARGHAVLHPQFLDSRPAPDGVEANEELRHAELRPMLFDPEHWVSRIHRVHAVLDSLATQTHLPATLQPDGVLVAGHSFGAFTAQLLLGTRLEGVGLDSERFAHSAVIGGMLLSPQGSGDRGLTSHSWDGVDVPVLVVTATNDLGPHGEGLNWRRESFDSVRSQLRHLAVVREGDHHLGGIASVDTRVGQEDTEVRDAISAVAGDFADAVHGDLEARARLASNPFPHLLVNEHQEDNT